MFFFADMMKAELSQSMNQKDSSPEKLEDLLPIIELSAKEVFSQMANSELTRAENYHPAASNVTAMVGLAGRLTGAMSVRCEKEAATLIASRMLGISLVDAAPNADDAIGEICNMVAGNFKFKIPGLGDGCFLTPPSVVTGGDYAVHARPETPRIHLTLLIEDRPVMISLYVAGRTSAKKAEAVLQQLSAKSTT
jgi:chemotaxis protein CheX